MVIQVRRQSNPHENEMNSNQTGSPKKISIDPKTWIKLGHFHLLLEEYRKGIYMSIKNIELYGVIEQNISFLIT